MLDLTDLYQDVQETTYIDSCCHLNDLGASLVFEAMVAELMSDDSLAAVRRASERPHRLLRVGRLDSPLPAHHSGSFGGELGTVCPLGASGIEPLLFATREPPMNDIQIYTTQWCPYCRMAKRLLQDKGQEFHEIDIEEQPDRRGEMVERSGRTSVPQIWIGERHVGGYDDLAALERAGELDALL